MDSRKQKNITITNSNDDFSTLFDFCKENIGPAKLIEFTIENCDSETTLELLDDYRKLDISKKITWGLVQTALKDGIFSAADRMMTIFPFLPLNATIPDLKIICDEVLDYPNKIWNGWNYAKDCIETILASPAVSNNSREAFKILSSSDKFSDVRCSVIKHAALDNLSNVISLSSTIYKSNSFRNLLGRLRCQGLHEDPFYIRALYKLFLRKKKKDAIDLLLYYDFDPRSGIPELNPESEKTFNTPLSLAMKYKCHHIFHKMFNYEKFPPSEELMIELLEIANDLTLKGACDIILSKLVFFREDQNESRKTKILDAGPFASANEGDYEMLEYWVEMFPFVLEEREKERGRSLLHLSCEYGSITNIRFLVERGMDILQPDSCGETPFQYCLQMPFRAACLSALLQSGSQIPVDLLNDLKEGKHEPASLITVESILEERNENILLTLLLSRRFEKNSLFNQDFLCNDLFFKILYLSQIDHVLPRRRRGLECQTMKRIKIEKN